MVVDDVNGLEDANLEQSSKNDEIEVTNVADYHGFSVSELIAELEKFCTKDLVEAHRKEIEEIRSLFYKKQKNETEEARKAYIEEHGDISGFVYETKENEFKEVYGRIRELRATLLQQKVDEQQKNLQKKLDIIEKLEKLTETPESMNKTFSEFRALQEEWKNSGDVASTEEKAIWDKYHLAVGKFYDYVKIDRELRDLDQKKNYDAKVALCEAAEKLSESKLVVKAFSDLQSLHEQWRKIGPVKEEFKEQLWERFKNATTVINKAHQDYFIGIKKTEEENLQKKTVLCERLDEIIANLDLTQKQWIAATDKVLELQKEWKTIGFAPQKQNNAIYERFSKACDVFFSAKKSFFGEVRDVENENKKQKVALCEKAEAMNSRTDWKEATLEFVRLQKDWKKIGPTAFRDSQKLWNRFSSACNTFFESKKNYEAQKDQALNDNIALKDALISKLTDISTDVKEDALKVLASIQDEWSKIQVPASAKADLQKRFSEGVNAVLTKLNVEKTASDNLAFRIKMSALALEKNGEDRLLQEVKRLKGKLSTVQTEIKSLENNVGFFSKSTDASKLIASVEKNIEKGKQEIVQLEQKIETIYSILRERK